MFERADSGLIGRIDSAPAMPPSIAQNAATIITVCNARSDATLAPSVTPPCPANTIFNASLARAGGADKML